MQSGRRCRGGRLSSPKLVSSYRHWNSAPPDTATARPSPSHNSSPACTACTPSRPPHPDTCRARTWRIRLASCRCCTCRRCSWSARATRRGRTCRDRRWCSPTRLPSSMRAMGCRACQLGTAAAPTRPTYSSGRACSSCTRSPPPFPDTCLARTWRTQSAACACCTCQRCS